MALRKILTDSNVYGFQDFLLVGETPQLNFLGREHLLPFKQNISLCPEVGPQPAKLLCEILNYKLK